MSLETSLTPAAIVALTIIMITGALVPGVSVLVVSARSATLGFFHGVLATLGIIVGDILFVLIALFGLSLLADIMGSHFDLIRYLAGLYLIWLGITLLRAGSAATGEAAGSRCWRVS